MRLTPTTTSTYRVIPRAEPCGHIPLMAKLSMLCGMGDRMKHTCTIRISIPPITSESIDSAAFAMRRASSGSFRTRGGDMFPLSTKTIDIRTNELEVIPANGIDITNKKPIFGLYLTKGIIT